MQRMLTYTDGEWWGYSEQEEREKRVNFANVQNNTWMQMEEILENLKVLDYETKFCKPNSIKPFARTMFAMKSSNKRLP